MALLAMDVESAKKIAIVIVIGCVVLAVLAAKFVKAAMAKAIVILLLGGMIGLTFTQRHSLTSCAKDIQTKYQQGDRSDTTCSFLGFDFNVKTAGGNSLRPDSNDTGG